MTTPVTRSGTLAAVSAYLIWGLAPIYWKALLAVPPLELLAHRIVWSCVLVIALLALRRSLGDIRTAVSRPRTAVTLLVTTALIAFNWGLFIWAVTTGRVLSASLGYYINPLVSVLLGFVVLGERLSRGQTVAVLLAAFGVAVLAVSIGRLPWVSLALAFSFGLYGLLRKTVRAEAAVGLAVETALLAPAAIAFLVARQLAGVGALGRLGAGTDALLLGAGLLTAVPMLLFTVGARRLPLSTLGLLQYIGPTCHFLLAVGLYGEPFGPAHAVTFGLIWLALALYTADTRRQVARRPA